MGTRKEGVTYVAQTPPSGGGGGGASTIIDGVNGAIVATVFDRPNSNPIAVELVDINGDPLAGSAVSIADGANVVEGALADVAIITDINGTINGKLRGLIKIFASVWDSINGRLKVDGSGVTQPISATSLPLPTGSATSALQTQPGVDIGDVTINNAAGAAAVNIQDGGNSLTVDGSVGISSGSITILGSEGLPASQQSLTGMLVVAQGNSPWDTTIGDGINTPVAVKAASTAPVASDKALVIAISPNTPTTVFGLKNEDAPSVDGDAGRPALAIRSDINRVLQSSDLDYACLIVDAIGRLQVDDRGFEQLKMRRLAEQSSLYPTYNSGDRLGMRDYGPINVVRQPMLGMS